MKHNAYACISLYTLHIHVHVQVIDIEKNRKKIYAKIM